MPNSGNRRGGSQSDDVDTSLAISNKDYYPTVDEMIHSEEETLTKLFASMKKEKVVCLLRETLSQLRSAVKQNENVGSSILQIGLEVKEIQRKMETSMEKIVSQDNIVHAIEPLIEKNYKNKSSIRYFKGCENSSKKVWL